MRKEQIRFDKRNAKWLKKLAVCIPIRSCDTQLVSAIGIDICQQDTIVAAWRTLNGQHQTVRNAQCLHAG